MALTPDSVCEHCGKTFLELSKEQAAMYTPMVHGQHPTCSRCMERGKEAGLGHDRIMVMNRDAFHRALKSHEQYVEKASEHKVIQFDPKKKLPKPKK